MDFPSQFDKIVPSYPSEDSYVNYNRQIINAPLREQDRFLPIANIARIMKKSIPQCGKIAKDAKECVQECVSEFISFITSEASDKCFAEKRKTINGDDIIYAMSILGFDPYIEALKSYLYKYRDSIKTNDKNHAANINDIDNARFQPQPQIKLSDLGTQILMRKMSMTLNSLNNIEASLVNQIPENSLVSEGGNPTNFLDSTNFTYNNHNTLPSIMEMTSMTSQVSDLRSPGNGMNLMDGTDPNANYDISHHEGHNQSYELVDFHETEPSPSSSFNNNNNNNNNNSHNGIMVQKVSKKSGKL